MLKVLIIRRKNLYIALAVLIALLVGILLLVTFSKSDETFSENLKYVYKKISADQAYVLISKNEDLTILDVRKEKDYLEGHIPNAILMPYKVVKKKYSSLDTQNKYLVYCDDGKHSEKIAKILSDNGFSQVFVLIGGMEKWDYELIQ